MLPNDPLVRELVMEEPYTRQLDWIVGNILDDAAASEKRVKKSQGWSSIGY